MEKALKIKKKNKNAVLYTFERVNLVLATKINSVLAVPLSRRELADPKNKWLPLISDNPEDLLAR